MGEGYKSLVELLEKKQKKILIFHSIHSSIEE